MTPQVTIYLDTTGALHAEAPGENGSRRKLDLAARGPDSDIFDALRASVFALGEELLSQRAREQDKKQRETERLRRLEAERHTRIVEYTAAHYPSALKYVDPRVLRASDKMRRKLRADGYTDAEITLMAQRGELVGTSFFTMPRAAQPSASSSLKSKSDRSEKLAKLEQAIASIQL